MILILSEGNDPRLGISPPGAFHGPRGEATSGGQQGAAQRPGGGGGCGSIRLAAVQTHKNSTRSPGNWYPFTNLFGEGTPRIGALAVGARPLTEVFLVGRGPLVPFYPFLGGEGSPSKRDVLKKVGTYSNLSTGGPRPRIADLPFAERKLCSFPLV